MSKTTAKKKTTTKKTTTAKSRQKAMEAANRNKAAMMAAQAKAAAASKAATAKKKTTAKSTTRQARALITYTPAKGKAHDSDTLREYLGTFTYTDCATGESDAATLDMANATLQWANKWLPKKGDKFTAKIKLYSWEKEGADVAFNCGTFCCDDRNYSGWPHQISIGGLSTPEKRAFRSTERSKSWKNITIKEIARQIAKRYKLSLSYYAGTIKVKTLQQDKKDDCSFLNTLCEDYGLYVKVYAGKIVIYDPVTYEKKKAVKNYKITDLLDYSYNSTLTGTYTGATIKYTKGKNKKEYTYKTGSGDRILSINEKVDNVNDAKLKAKARLNKENRKAETMTATFVANFKIAAGNCIRITDGYDLAGKYFIDKATHTVKADGVYTISAEMHKVPEAKATKPTKPATPAKKPTKPSKPTSKTVYYRVTPGIGLNVRSKPNGSIIGAMPYKTTVQSDGKKQGGWIHVKWKGKWGWSYGAYLKKK